MIKTRQLLHTLHKNLCKEALILFDNDSTATYITEKLAGELFLNIKKNQVVSFNTFENDRAHNVASNIVELELLQENNSAITVQGVTMAKLTAEIPHAVVN